MKNLNLMWEKSIDGRAGVYKAPIKVNLTPILLKKLAIAKMMEIRLISANFSDNPILFTPHVCLLFDSFSKLEFIGLYTANVSDETNEDISSENLPFLCLRRAFWDKNKDVNNFQTSNDKQAYILSEQQTDVDVIFIKIDSLPELTRIVSDSVEIAKNGVKLQKSTKIDTPYSEINLVISDISYHFNLSYDPSVLTSIYLEDLTSRWRSFLDNFPMEKHIIPDEDFRISYNLSIFDQINMISNLTIL